MLFDYLQNIKAIQSTIKRWGIYAKVLQYHICFAMFQNQ